MLFKISEDKKSISRFHSSWNPTELDVEKLIFYGAEDNEGIATFLGEQLLLVKRQVDTFQKKRADILAVDRQGNGVIIELKRDGGFAGVELRRFSTFLHLLHSAGESLYVDSRRIQKSSKAASEVF